MKSFMYLGQKFTPVRQFTSDEREAGLLVVGSSTGISNYKDMPALSHISSDYSYDDFYAAAKKAGAENIDIFYMGELRTPKKCIEVIPCQNELFTFNAGVLIKKWVKA